MMSDPLPLTAARADPRWRLPTLIAFRFSFTYLILYLFLNGNVTVLSFIPFLQGWLTAPLAALAAGVGKHFFHLTGIAGRWHGGGSGDTALNYVRILIIFVVAVVATPVWSVLDRRRRHYSLLSAWLRFLLRLTVGIGMLVYGFAKLVPLQMREPTFAILNNTYGNSSPMTLLWTMIGLHPVYESVCGLAELAGGFLLLYRRTATLGALFSGFVMTNVVLYNFFFDVPVKIYSLHLLLICIFLLLPEFGALWRFFVGHRPAELTGVWVPPASRRAFRVATAVVETLILAGISLALLLGDLHGWRVQRRSMSPTPLLGAWEVDPGAAAATRTLPVSPEGRPWAALYVDNRREGFYRSDDGALWRCAFDDDEAKHHLRISAAAIKAVVYDWSVPDRDHLELRRAGDDQAGTIRFHRLAAPEHYPLTERRFNWINEWGYER